MKNQTKRKQGFLFTRIVKGAVWMVVLYQPIKKPSQSSRGIKEGGRYKKIK